MPHYARIFRTKKGPDFSPLVFVHNSSIPLKNSVRDAAAPPDQGAGQLNALLGVRNLVLRRVVRLNNRSWLRRHVAPGGLLTPFLAQP
jgi:hypothetical protein